MATTTKTFGEFTVNAETDRDDLYSDFVEAIRGALEDDVTEDDLFSLLNEYRDANNYDILKINDDYTVNEELRDCDPIDILRCAEDWDECDDYLISNGYGEFATTNDVWYDCDAEAVAEWIAENEDAHGVSEIDDIITDYNDALEALDEMEDEDEDAEAKARAKARAEAIAELVNDATIKALVVCLGNGKPQDFKHDLSVVKARLGVAFGELFDEVTEYARQEGKTS